MGLNFNFKMPNISMPNISLDSIKNIDVSNFNLDAIKNIDLKGAISSVSADSIGAGSIESALNKVAGDLPSKLESLSNQAQNGEEIDLSAINLDLNF